MGGYTSTHAFTLIELLIAVLVFAIVLASINAVFYSAVRLRNKAAQSFDEAQPLQQTTAIIEHDLASLVIPGGTLSGVFQTTSGSNSVSGQISPDFYTASGLIDPNDLVPWGEVQRVSYSLLDSTNGSAGKDLVRFVTRNLLAGSVQETPAQQFLMSGVDNLAFRYYDGTTWRESWDSSSQTNLPLAIKVQISLTSTQRLAGLTAPIELVVPVSVQVPTNQTAQASGGGG